MYHYYRVLRSLQNLTKPHHFMLSLIMFESESMFNSKLQPMFNGSVLMNDKAIHDQAVMNALQSFAEDNFEFKTIDSSYYNISDKD